MFLKGQLNTWYLEESEELTGELTGPVTLVFDELQKIRHVFYKMQQRVTCPDICLKQN